MPAMPFDNQLTASQSEADFIYTSFQGHRRQFCPAFSAASGLWLQGTSVHPCLTGPKVEGASLSSPIGLRFFFVGSNWKRRIQSHPPPQKTNQFSDTKIFIRFSRERFFLREQLRVICGGVLFFSGVKSKAFSRLFQKKLFASSTRAPCRKVRVTGFFLCFSLKSRPWIPNSLESDAIRQPFGWEVNKLENLQLKTLSGVCCNMFFQAEKVGCFFSLMETKSSKGARNGSWKIQDEGETTSVETALCLPVSEQLSKCQRGPGDGGGSSMKVSGVLRTFGPERWKGGRWYSCRFVVFSSCGSRMVVSIGVPAKSCACQKVAVFSGQKLRCFQRSYMGDPMSMRDFEDDEITTSNWDLVGDDPMPQLDIWKKAEIFDEGKWTDMIRNVGFFLQTLSLEAWLFWEGWISGCEENVDTWDRGFRKKTISR